MSRQIVDLRSDTVTQPSVEMRSAIASAEVGDDVIGTDPTVDKLQKLTADILGKEDALYMPSGSMTNQIAVRLHCKPGDEFICEAGCHIYNYEQGAFAQLSGVVARTVDSEGGVLQLSQLLGLVRPENEHLVRTRMVCLENTHNRAAGKVQPYDTVAEICAWARENGLRTHMDGARLFNAVAASGISAADWSQHFDTVSVCFSKGLGAPVGSALAGSREAIAEARRHRKLFGGGMRQVGIIAAGALYALENNLERLSDDHANAQTLADAVRGAEGLCLAPTEVDTNIVFCRVDPELGSAADFVAALAAENVLALATGPALMRMVTHLDVDSSGATRAAEVIPQIASQLAAGVRPAAHNIGTY